MRKGWRIDYNRGDGIVEVIVRDHSGGKHDKFIANQQDKKAHGRIGKILSDKYGIDFTPVVPVEKEDGFFDY